MTTPDTSAVRAWAKDNGYEVASRGRLPAEVTDAYLAANGTKGKAPAKKAAAQKPPTATRSAAPKPAAARRSSGKAAAVVEAPAVAEQAAPQQAEQPPAAEPTPAKTPRPKPSLVSDDRRLVALGEEIKALAARVEALEKASGGSKSGSSSKATRFRRRS